MQLKVAASLAIGNFACSEENCVQLMENNTSHVLISLLKAHQNPNTDLKLQHALLGSLRNLAVAARARKQLLDQGSTSNTDPDNVLGTVFKKISINLFGFQVS